MGFRSRGAFASESRSTNHEKTGPDPVSDRRRWYRLHLDRARLTKNQEGETPTDAYSFSPHQRMRPRALISFASPACGRGSEGRARLSAFHRGACGSEPTPPLNSSTRFLGRGRGARSRWFERPCALQRALPAPSCPSPASSLQTGHDAGRALSRSRPRTAVTSRRPREPHSPRPLASPGGRPVSRARFATFVSEMGTNVNEKVTD